MLEALSTERNNADEVEAKPDASRINWNRYYLFEVFLGVFEGVSAVTGARACACSGAGAG